MKYIHIMLIIILIFGTISCKEKQQNKTLLFSPRVSVIKDKKIILDSIVIHKSEKNILIRQYRGAGDFLEIELIKIKNGFSEIRKQFYGLIENETDIKKADLMPIDTLPIFYRSDTIFTYKSNRNFYHSTMDLSLGNGVYKIEKNENTYVFSKKSTIDSSYEEEYYYNIDFDIIKYIVKYRGNIYVYK